MKEASLLGGYQLAAGTQRPKVAQVGHGLPFVAKFYTQAQARLHAFGYALQRQGQALATTLCERASAAAVARNDEPAGATTAPNAGSPPCTGSSARP
uniref:Uncharacterized protein n=1 Tax=Tanacetum cinerariifolium TaxID=118510 RepID=A0A699T125_TANCI|nr:hypothetical protein [Tanacetum cinerariifolium]